MSAVFSPCRTWRYTLTRLTERALDTEALVAVGGMAVETIEQDEWLTLDLSTGSLYRKRTVAFIGLNPSTADEVVNDATIRRCVGFASRWDFTHMVMLNLFAFRSTDPKVLRGLSFADSIGPHNDEHIFREALAADLVVCAWGTYGALFSKRGELLATLLRSRGVELHVLGLTKDGHPKHALYLRGDLMPIPWVS